MHLCHDGNYVNFIAAAAKQSATRSMTTMKAIINFACHTFQNIAHCVKNVFFSSKKSQFDFQLIKPNVPLSTELPDTAARFFLPLRETIEELAKLRTLWQY